MSRALLGSRWRAPHGELVVVEHPYSSDVAAVERAWRPHREPTLDHWDWRRIMRAHAERYCVRADDEVVALIAADPVILLSSGAWYLAQWIEVGPAHRGKKLWGALVVALLCARAREANADFVGIPSLPERAGWYRALGATAAPPGWSAPGGLVSLALDRDAIAQHAGRLDGLREEEEGP